MLRRFNLDALADWRSIDSGTWLAFDSAGEDRRVRLSINAEFPVTVTASDSEDGQPVFLARQDGLFEVAFTAEGPVSYVHITAGQLGGYIFVASHSPSHVVEPTDDVVFTTLEPAARRNSDLDRMVQLMRLNEQRRDQRLQDELEAVRAAGRPAATPLPVPPAPAGREASPEVLEPGA